MVPLTNRGAERRTQDDYDRCAGAQAADCALAHGHDRRSAGRRSVAAGPLGKDLKARDTVRSLLRLRGDRRSTTVRGGGKPNPAMAAMPLREWPRRLGALPQKRKTASWLRSKWINRIQAWLVQRRTPKAGSPRINIHASRPSATGCRRARHRQGAAWPSHSIR